MYKFLLTVDAGIPLVRLPEGSVRLAGELEEGRPQPVAREDVLSRARVGDGGAHGNGRAVICI